jgi:hypothetical protein
VLPAGKLCRICSKFHRYSKEDGSIDGKRAIRPGAGRYLAPLLASLTWKHYQKSEDQNFLGKVFPKLHNFFWSWFSPEYDEDRDGLPQWKHTLQTGFEDNPLFDAWHEWSLGVDITQIHSPALEAMLYHEAACLIKMAEQLDQYDMLPLLHEQAAKLRSSIESTWQSRTGLCGASCATWRRKRRSSGSSRRRSAGHTRSGVRDRHADESAHKPRTGIASKPPSCF